MIKQLKKYKIFKDQTLTRLELLPSQGYCNENYVLHTENQKYLIRKFRLADRDRNAEYRIQKMAAKHSIGAVPYLLDTQNAIMISDFIEGAHKKRLSQREIRALARIIKKLHTLRIRHHALTLPTPFRTKAARLKKEHVLCHNDLSIKNILFEKKPKLIDWEYAGMNDRCFDLASVIKEFGFNKREETSFLKAYGKKIHPKKLVLFKEIYTFLYQQWFEKLEKGELDFL